MVKADLSRDYYGDLGLDPNADLEAIKKQFKKLALAYHPDRNPGKESEVIGKFQKIQSAHEVLSDPQERAKYDTGRLRASGGAFRQSYNGSTASGMRGNPWANAGAGWAPPPKPPTARKQPPPSAGAQRYKNFETPKTSASYAAQEGPEARRSTYEAWEHMKNQKSSDGARPSPGQGSSRSNRPVPPTPGERPPRSYDQGSFRRTAPGYDDWPGSEGYQPTPGSGANSPRRAQSSAGTNRKGFMPNTPGGDEPAAPRGAYSGYNKKSTAPPPPPRNPPNSTPRPPAEPPRYAERVDPVFEPRVSTPYATHGGEKLNPFESANINRSKSTRERPDRYGPNGEIPRSGSDPNFSSPHHRSNSFAGRSSNLRTPTGTREPSHTEPSSSSSESGPEMKGPSTPLGRRYAQPKASATSSSENVNATTEPMSNESDSARHATANQTTNGETMYAFPSNISTSSKQPPFLPFQSTLPTVLESPNVRKHRLSSTPNIFHTAAKAAHSNGLPDSFSDSPFLSTSPTTAGSQSLNAFEDVQRTLVERLLRRREASERLGRSYSDAMPETTSSRAQTSVPDFNHQKSPSEGFSKVQQAVGTQENDRFNNWLRASAQMDSPSKKQNTTFSSYLNVDSAPYSWQTPELKEEYANKLDTDRFSFNVDDSTFKRTQSHPNGFRANSAENISTKFTPEDWDGKFEAGADYFRPEQKASNMPGRARAQSTSRSRGRSPVKVRPVDPIPPPADEPPLQSPGGTKFSPEEWAQSFKPQTFAPPPIPVRSNTGSRKPRVTVRPTAGTAAVVDDSDSSIEKRVFTGRKNSGKIPTPPSPDAMDVDTPPTSTKQVPTPPPREPLNVKTDSPQKRAAAVSATHSPTTDTEASRLKVNFEDLKIQDLISSLSLPSPPKTPLPPPNTLILTPTHPAYLAYKDAFKVYMCDWDLFNSQFLLHLVARKNQNDAMGARRWEDDEACRIYRMGLKEDGVVLGHLQAAMLVHEESLREWKIVKERVRRMEAQGREGGGERRQRMKTR